MHKSKIFFTYHMSTCWAKFWDLFNLYVYMLSKIPRYFLLLTCLPVEQNSEIFFLLFMSACWAKLWDSFYLSHVYLLSKIGRYFLLITSLPVEQNSEIYFTYHMSTYWAKLWDFFSLFMSAYFNRQTWKVKKKIKGKFVFCLRFHLLKLVVWFPYLADNTWCIWL